MRLVACAAQQPSRDTRDGNDVLPPEASHRCLSWELHAVCGLASTAEGGLLCVQNSEHSSPFLICVRPDDTLAELRERLRARLGVPPEEFHNWGLFLAMPNPTTFSPLKEEEMKPVFEFAQVRLPSLLSRLTCFVRLICAHVLCPLQSFCVPQVCNNVGPGARCDPAAAHGLGCQAQKLAHPAKLPACLACSPGPVPPVPAARGLGTLAGEPCLACWQAADSSVSGAEVLRARAQLGHPAVPGPGACRGQAAPALALRARNGPSPSAELKGFSRSAPSRSRWGPWAPLPGVPWLASGVQGAGMLGGCCFQYRGILTLRGKESGTPQHGFACPCSPASRLAQQHQQLLLGHVHPGSARPSQLSLQYRR